MIGMIEGVREAAYARWEHRGRVHGFDRHDWLAAEGQERLSRLYQIVSADRLDCGAPRSIGSGHRRRCRFCDQGAPRATFPNGVHVFPTAFGPGGPFAFDQCEECVAEFASGIDPALDRFVALDGAEPDARRGIPVDAFKGLTKLALAVMPQVDLDDHEETIDWVGNPDHDFDLSVFRGLACIVHQIPRPYPASWAALARREGDEACPSMLFFLGRGRSVFQISVPLNRRDDELDVPISAIPDVLPPCPFGLGFDPLGRRVLPITAYVPTNANLTPSIARHAACA